MMKVSGVKKQPWTPAIPCRHPDNIISSDYTTAKVFIPSYDREPKPCIEQLLTNDYQRIWWKEHEAWIKMQFREPEKKKKFHPPNAVVPKKKRETTLNKLRNKSDPTAKTKTAKKKSTAVKK